MPPAPGSVACPALTHFTMRTLLFMVCLLPIANIAFAQVNQHRLDSIEREAQIREQRMRSDRNYREEVEEAREMRADMERFQTERQNQRLSRYFFPWGIVAAYALCAFLYWRPKLLPAFFYRNLWLTVTLVGLSLLWWPVIFMVKHTDAGNAEMIPKMIGDTVQLFLVISLGYGAFLLTRKYIKPVE